MRIRTRSGSDRVVNEALNRDVVSRTRRSWLLEWGDSTPSLPLPADSRAPLALSCVVAAFMHGPYTAGTLIRAMELGFYADI